MWVETRHEPGWLSALGTAAGTQTDAVNALRQAAPSATVTQGASFTESEPEPESGQRVSGSGLHSWRPGADAGCRGPAPSGSAQPLAAWRANGAKTITNRVPYAVFDACSVRVPEHGVETPAQVPSDRPA
ncbi:hypothetical protein GCM10017674_80100 [Streptomyces gardneri]|uniref:Uncharacterized protein n=1 Tax=Streptomyces gardneri TaxID=66892 RepID=A0A4Y3RXG7_9ACTN|nr:hypothetical protein SGA01_77100 [Streptomyces gardneri]GHH23477.1 hypothetical protein GCM10017674_80100 [Streptomyces gardneri]